MKKIILTILCATLFSQVSMAQDLDSLLKKVAKAENVESLKLDGFTLWLGKMFGAASELPNSLQNINKIEIHDLSTCSEQLRLEITDEIKKLNSNSSYETLSQIKNKGEHVKVLLKKEKEHIKEFLVLISKDNAPKVIRIHGNIHQDDLAELMSKYSTN